MTTVMDAVVSNPVVCRLLTLMILEKVFDEFYAFLKLILGSKFYIYYIKYIAV